jgi:3-hydroxy-3-methylglutaryl CoA synthase
VSSTKAGIARWGTYIPQTRLPFALIGGRPAKDGGPERTVAAFDEDAITMAVEAATRCLADDDRSTIDALYFATTTPPYGGNLGAALIAKALDLPRGIRSADFGGSLRAGSSALMGATDAVAAGTATRVLVVAADCRLAPPRSALERNFGDAAAAFIVASDDIAATCDSQAAISDEMLDVWRASDDRFVRSWEDRFVTQHGYGDNIRELLATLFKREGFDAAGFTRVALYAPDARAHATTGRGLGFSAEQLVDPMFGRLGNCGAAFAPILLAAALEASQNEDRILSVAYGDGGEASSWTVTARVRRAAPGATIADQLATRRPLRSYDSYLAARRLIETGIDSRGGTGVPATTHWRERDHDISLHAERCRQCGTHHFPAQRICYGCAAKDDFESVRLSDKRGKLMSYTFDSFFPTPEPPLVAGMVEVDGGCRIYLQLCDVDPKAVRCDMPVAFVFRKIHEAGAKPNYFWKARPTIQSNGIAAESAPEASRP